MADREVRVKLVVDTSEYAAAIKSARRPTWAIDLAESLGYAPESWDGMWKLTANPFTFGPDYVLAEEIVYQDGTQEPILDGDKFRTQQVRHQLPEGWTTAPVYRVVPPAR